jgi:hypothetical protein
MGLFSGRTVKPAGSSSLDAGRRKMHGSANQRKLMNKSGNTARNDEKPRGFLSRHDKPATGRGRGGPWG